MLALALLLLGMSGCTSEASSDYGTDEANSNADQNVASASASPGATASAAASASASTDSASPSASAGSSASTDSTSTASASSSSSAGTDAARFAGMRSSTSWECYTFYSDGTVELRHGGTSAISDTGTYQGDEDFGEIVWDSGRWTSTVVAQGDGLIIDDAEFSPVESCY